MAFVPADEFVPTLAHGIAHAAVYCTDTRGRALLLASAHHTGEYQSPGGILEAGEDPWACAVRETREELGFVPHSLATPRLLVLAFSGPRPPWPWLIAVVFDGGRLTDGELDRIALDPEEHTGWAVRTVADWAPLVSPRRLGVLQASATARRTGRTGYLHPDGPPVGETA